MVIASIGGGGGSPSSFLLFLFVRTNEIRWKSFTPRFSQIKTKEEKKNRKKKVIKPSKTHITQKTSSKSL